MIFRKKGHFVRIAAFLFIFSKNSIHKKRKTISNHNITRRNSPVIFVNSEVAHNWSERGSIASRSISVNMSDERDSRGQERDGGAVRDRSRSRDRSSGGGGGGGGAVGGEDAKLFVGNLSFEARYVT